MKIAWTSLRDGNFQVWVMNAAGTNPVRVSAPPGEDYMGSWR
jgi:Tol biopolymer transport system component